MTPSEAARLVLRLEQENRRLGAEVAELGERLSAVQHECANLMNLCVASDRLYGAADAADVIRGLEEILVNLVGADAIAIFELSGETLRPSLLSCHAIDPDRLGDLPLDIGAIGESVRTGRVFAQPDSAEVVACVPLRRDDRIAGLIVVYRMLPQKNRLTSNDLALLDHLALHGAIALHSKRTAAR